MKKIGLIAGSLRAESAARKVAKNLGMGLPNVLIPEWISIEELPLYHEHLTDREQAACATFRAAIAAVDGLCIVTPEINHGMPGCLKNALDIASVSDTGSAWGGKPAVLAAVSTGEMGGISASQDLKQVALTVGMQIVQPCEVYLGKIEDHLDDHGILQVDPLTRDFLALALDHLATAVGAPTDRFDFRLTASELTLLADKQAVGRGKLSLAGQQLTIEQIKVAESHRGRGLAAQLMLRLLVLAQLFDWQIVPACSYAQWFFEQHPSAQALLVPQA